ncbi:MAG: tail fiber protein [Bacteroidetes bacterium]|nr:tail fiber protein [Bacteroidota bacterium]
MSEPFLGEIMIAGFNFAPKGWALCNGQLMQIQQNQALFALLGTMYGGNGQTTFALPDLQGRAAMHHTDVFPQGLKGGSATVTLDTTQIPQHQHNMVAIVVDPSINTNNPAGALYTNTAPAEFYAATLNATQPNPATIAQTGTNTPHNNLQPSLVLNFCIALRGIFPSRN